MNNSNRNYKIKKYYKHKYANNKTDFVIAIIKIGKIPAFRSKSKDFFYLLIFPNFFMDFTECFFRA